MGIAADILAKQQGAPTTAPIGTRAPAAPRTTSSGGQGLAAKILSKTQAPGYVDRHDQLAAKRREQDQLTGTNTRLRTQDPFTARAQGEQKQADNLIDRDFKALQDGDPDAVQDWREIARVAVGLSVADDPGATDVMNSLLWAYGDQIKDHAEVVEPGWWEENYTEPPEVQDDSRFGWKSKLGAIADSGVFEYMDQLLKGSLGTVAGINSAIRQDDGVSVTEGLTHAAKSAFTAGDISQFGPGGGISGQVLKNFDANEIKVDGGDRYKMLDNTGDGTVNLREALGMKGDEGGRLLGAIDLIGQIALDPTTYLTLGAGSLAKVGMKGAEETAAKAAAAATKSLAREVAEEAGVKLSREWAAKINVLIKRSGFKNLAEHEQRIYTQLIKDGTEDATTRILGRDLGEAQLQSITRGGRSGVRFGGSTVLPTGKLGDVLTGSDEFAERVVKNADEVAEGGAKLADDVADTALELGTSNRIDPEKVIPEATGDLIDLPDSALRDITELADKIPKVGRLGDELPAQEALTEVYRVMGQRGLLGQAFDALPPKMQETIAALSPRAFVTSRFGKAISDQLGGLMSLNRHSAPEVKDIIERLGADMHKNGLMERSIREFGTQDEWEKYLNTALSSKEAREGALESAGEATKSLISTYHTIREELLEVAKRSGANPDHLHDIDSYIPRILTDANRRDADLLDALNAYEGGVVDPGTVRLTEGHMEGRTIATHLSSLHEVNSEAYRVLKNAGIDAPEQLFENNPVAALVSRSRTGYQAASEVDMLTGITKLDFDGSSLAFRASYDDGQKLTAHEVAKGMIRDTGAEVADYRAVHLGNGDIFMVHKDIKKELESARMIFGDPKQLSEFGRKFDQINNMWARSATVFGLNPAFHTRNGVGNVFNAFLGGTRDVSVYTAAMKIQKNEQRVLTKAMRETGESWEVASKRLITEGKLEQASFDLLDGARKMGVLGDGQALDILRESGGRAQQGKSSKWNPVGDNFALDAPGLAMGTAIEENARLGVYIDQIRKGASPEQAAQHVKKYLFDYGDLTRFENEIMRRGSRFYTFLRKNTALQAYSLAHYPGRVKNAEKGIDGIIAGMFGEEDGSGLALPPWMPGAKVYGLDGASLAVDLDTPFSSFQETMKILTGPDTDNDPLAQFGKNDWLGGIVGRSEALFAGVALGTLKWMEEVETGRDSFTGRTLDPENQYRDNKYFGLVSSVLPGVGRVEGQLARFGAVNEALQLRTDADGNMKDNKPWKQALIANFAGLQTYELSEDTENAGRYTLIKDLEAILGEMKKDGLDVPTTEEMRASGDIGLKDRVAETLMYGWDTDPETGAITWNSEGANAKLLQILPKHVRDAFVDLGILTEAEAAASDAAGRVTPKGARPDVDEDSEEFKAQQDHDFAQAMTAIETYLERKLSDDEKWTMVSAFGGALGVTDQENAGFDPYRENRLLDPEKTEAEETADLERKTELFNRRLASVGLTWEMAMERNPRISVMQRHMEEARAAGWTDDEIRYALYYATDEGGEGWTSRADRAALNQFLTGEREGGAVPLTTTRFPMTSDEDLQKLQTKVWNAAEEIRLLYAFEGWGTPSQDVLFMYGMNTLTKDEQRRLGIDPLKGAPNRDDVRTDAEKNQDAQAKGQAVTAGLDSPYRWAPTAQPDYAPWEMPDYGN